MTNSTHNFIHKHKTDTSLRYDLIEAGIDRDLFHPNWRTKFPAHRRMEAITQWQLDHGLADWIAFDDERFTEQERLIWINPDVGISVHHYNEAAVFWELKPFWVM